MCLVTLKVNCGGGRDSVFYCESQLGGDLAACREAMHSDGVGRGAQKKRG